MSEHSYREDFHFPDGNASIARLLTTVHLYRVPVSGEGSGIEQFRAGRYELLGTPFATFEQKIREQLGAMLAEGGFDPARDIKGISVNRWPHGYAVGYDYQSGELNWFGNTWPEDHKLWLRGRQRSRDMSKVELNALNGRLGQLVFDDDQFLAGTSKIESQTSRT
ncbi:MAG: hypothetical protein WD672_00415 [Woeseia sp.]